LGRPWRLRRSVWDCRVDELLKPIRSTFDGTTAVVEVEARTRRGKDVRCRVTSSPLTRDDGSVAGAVLVIEEL
jgi:hypothetical protein